jgi:hypothetical protein
MVLLPRAGCCNACSAADARHQSSDRRLLSRMSRTTLGDTVSGVMETAWSAAIPVLPRNSRTFASADRHPLAEISHRDDWMQAMIIAGRGFGFRSFAVTMPDICKSGQPNHQPFAGTGAAGLSRSAVSKTFQTVSKLAYLPICVTIFEISANN